LPTRERSLSQLEDVIGGAVLGEVGVFEGAHADDTGDVVAVFGGEIGVLARTTARARSSASSRSSSRPTTSPARGLEGFAIFAEDGAEPDVLETDGSVAPHTRGR